MATPARPRIRGVDRSSLDPAKHRWFAMNFAGVGYGENAFVEALEGQPLPNTEETNRPIQKPDGEYVPMAFGPLARAWQPRPDQWAGTYRRTVERSESASPSGRLRQSLLPGGPARSADGLPKRGREGRLDSPHAGGSYAFRLPRHSGLTVVFAMRNGAVTEVPAVVDTILLEPDEGQFALVWRARLPLRRDVFDVREVIVEQRRIGGDDARRGSRVGNRRSTRWRRWPRTIASVAAPAGGAVAASEYVHWRYGMVCSVGFDAAAACAAMRAGVSGRLSCRTSTISDSGLSERAFRALASGCQRGPRLVQLLANALADLLDAQPEVKNNELPPLILLPG